jgi:hypothetical protein
MPHDEPSPVPPDHERERPQRATCCRGTENASSRHSLDLHRSGLGERHGAFVQGLRDLGWVDGQNFVIEARFAEGKPDRPGGPCDRSGGSSGGRGGGAQCPSRKRDEAAHRDDPDRHGQRARSCRPRVRQEPLVSGWQRHRARDSDGGNRRQEPGAAQGGPSQALQPGRAGEPVQSGRAHIRERDRANRPSDRDQGYAL